MSCPESLSNALTANPLNMQARYTIARDHLGALSRSEAPQNIQEIAAEPAGSASAVIEGLRYEPALEGQPAESLLTEHLARGGGPPAHRMAGQYC